MIAHPTKAQLFDAGRRHIALWCSLNGVDMPKIVTHTGKPDFGTCAYYRDGQIEIWVNSCAAVGLVGRQWSYPGYVVDRTPYGVLAHELGHHVDKQHGARGGFRSHAWRPLDAAPLTGYCPNDNEWFAELFRLFVTNMQADAKLNCERNAKLKALALDMLAEQFGQADWQRFRRDNPYAFFLAKLEIVSGPPGLRVHIEPSVRDPDECLFRFVFRKCGAWRHLPLTANFREICDEDRGDVFFEGIVLRRASIQITRDSGVETKLRALGNRAAYARALEPHVEAVTRPDHEYVCGPTRCGVCGVTAVVSPPMFCEQLPCGHAASAMVVERILVDRFTGERA